jgi:hypothetical protein
MWELFLADVGELYQDGSDVARPFGDMLFAASSGTSVFVPLINILDFSETFIEDGIKAFILTSDQVTRWDRDGRGEDGGEGEEEEEERDEFHEGLHVESLFAGF